MELRQLRYFLAIAESLSFRRASHALAISQPALSQRIKALEETIGVNLFDRSSTGVTLTPAGEALRESAVRILADVDLAVEAALLADRREEGTLSLSFNELAGQQALFARCLSLYRSAFPRITVQLSEFSMARQRDALRAGAIDAGFHFRFSGAVDALACRVLGRQQFRLAVGADHPLATHDFVDLKQLDGQPMVRLRREVNAETYDSLDAAFSAAHVRPNVIVEASSDAAMLALVAAGIGFGIVMGAQRRGGSSEIVLLPIAGLSLAKDLVVAWNPSNRSAALLKFLTIAARAVAEEDLR